MFKAIGKNPSGERLRRTQSSKNWKDGSFQNMETTSVNPNKISVFKMFWEFFNKSKDVRPGQALKAVVENLREYDGSPSLTWFGHSSYLLQFPGCNVLVDPVFSGYASPVSFFGKSFPGTDVYTSEEMPEIDILLLTHDHYDHLDYRTIKALKGKVKKVIASLGVGSHLEYWGYESYIITELDWHEEIRVNEQVKLTALPSRHFSGRNMTRGLTLWSAFSLQINDYKIFLGGDSGYDKVFKKIGEEHGPFDLAILECGQYGDDWPQIHMLPEEVPQAATDLRAKTLLPVHWAKFALSTHPWADPAIRLHNAVKKFPTLNVEFPVLGKRYKLSELDCKDCWWEEALD